MRLNDVIKIGDKVGRFLVDPWYSLWREKKDSSYKYDFNRALYNPVRRNMVLATGYLLGKYLLTKDVNLNDIALAYGLATVDVVLEGLIIFR